MPNIKSPRNTIIVGGSTITIETGRYEFSALFEIFADTAVNFTLITTTGKIQMVNTETVTSTDLLKDFFGFTETSYAPGTHISENTPTIDDYSTVHIICDEVIQEHIINIGTESRRISSLFNFSITDYSNYESISLVKSNNIPSTLRPSAILNKITFRLVDEKLRALDFGEHDSEFRVFAQIKKTG
jgi:hypothetical protein